MLLSLILACTMGYNKDSEGVSLSFEQTAATHYFYYDTPTGNLFQTQVEAFLAATD